MNQCQITIDQYLDSWPTILLISPNQAAFFLTINFTFVRIKSRYNEYYGSISGINKVPSNIKNCVRVRSFKKELKYFLVNECFYNIDSLL